MFYQTIVMSRTIAQNRKVTIDELRKAEENLSMVLCLCQMKDGKFKKLNAKWPGTYVVLLNNQIQLETKSVDKALETYNEL